MSVELDKPRIEVVSPASDTEAAAIVAAMEQFLADTAPTPASSGAEMSPWQAAALRDAVAARQVGGGVWGHAPSWNQP